MLFKAGLASETLLKREQKLSNRRAWANRKVSEHETKLSNIPLLLQDDPTKSPLIKESEKSDLNLDLMNTVNSTKSRKNSVQNDSRPRT